LKLDEIGPNIGLVKCTVAEVIIMDEDAKAVGYGSLQYIIMPHYPMSLAMAPQMPSKALLAGVTTMQRALDYIHSHNFCHSDINHLIIHLFVFLL
jgi:hypothetical protein